MHPKAAMWRPHFQERGQPLWRTKIVEIACEIFRLGVSDARGVPVTDRAPDFEKGRGSDRVPPKTGTEMHDDAARGRKFAEG